MSRPRVLTVAGIDPCGGAGLVVDVRVIDACGGEPAAVPTCTTVQNRHGFRSARATPRAEFRAMLDAVVADALPSAVKLGMCVEPEKVVEFAAFWATLDAGLPLVVDPVGAATAGGAPTRVADVAAAIVASLAPLGAILTPNLDELAGIGDPAALLAAGSRAVVVTGGHGPGDSIIDRLLLPQRAASIERPRIDRGPLHGTGCAFAAALATRLAQGDGIEQAFATSVDLVRGWIAATTAARDGLPVPLRIAGEA